MATVKFEKVIPNRGMYYKVLCQALGEAYGRQVTDVRMPTMVKGSQIEFSVGMEMLEDRVVEFVTGFTYGFMAQTNPVT